MSSAQHVVIVLAVHRPDLNYLAEQIDSILAQDYRDFTLLLVLDGDESRTAGKLAQLSDPRVEVIAQKGSSGIRNTFFFGLEWGLAKDRGQNCCFAYCDQDDVWREDKLTRLTSLMRSSGAQLCYSDAQVIGANGEIVADSLYRLEKRRPGGTLPDLLISNHVSGMTMLFSSRVAQLVVKWPPPTKEPAIFHDWWTALVAMSAGSAAFDPEPLVSYRRHAGNVIGPAIPEQREQNRKFLSSAYLDMCKNKFALRVRIWDELHRMAESEGLPRPSEPVEEVLKPMRLLKTAFRDRGQLGLRAFRILVGRWALRRQARQAPNNNVEELSAKQLRSASTDDPS